MLDFSDTKKRPPAATDGEKQTIFTMTLYRFLGTMSRKDRTNYANENSNDANGQTDRYNLQIA